MEVAGRSESGGPMGGAYEQEVVGDPSVGSRAVMTGIPVWQLDSFS